MINSAPLPPLQRGQFSTTAAPMPAPQPRVDLASLIGSIPPEMLQQYSFHPLLQPPGDPRQMNIREPIGGERIEKLYQRSPELGLQMRDWAASAPTDQAGMQAWMAQRPQVRDFRPAQPAPIQPPGIPRHPNQQGGGFMTRKRGFFSGGSR